MRSAVLVLIFLPFLGTFISLVVRGKDMGERAIASARKQQTLAAEYASGLGSSQGGPADQIEKAKALLDQGIIDAQEFAALKAKALA